MAIQMRRGNQVDFDPSKMVPGEFAIAQDQEHLYLCYRPGRVLEIGSASTIIPFVQEAEAWARGTKDDEPVSIADPQYHNNSKYYAEQADTSADNAATSETNAASSETGAQESAEDAEAWAVGTRSGQDVPSTDETYHNNSKYYSEQSETYVEDSEAWAVGTKNGTPVTPLDPQYNNNAKHWADSAAAIVGIGIATTEVAGIVKPDGTSITVDPDGTIHTSANIAIVGKKVVVS